MTHPDSFAELSRYYDPLMGEVDYDRWWVVATLLADIANRPELRHIDLACGTGRLLKRLVQHGWRSIGIDLSPGMLRVAREGPYTAPTAVADLTALPFTRRFDYATCIFDSLNFLLDEDDLRAAMHAAANALDEGGVFYFDVITERMVLDHFAGKTWSEDNGTFSTTWTGRYDRVTRIAELDIRVNTGPSYQVRERAYPLETVRDAAEAAGFTVLGQYDAETWKPASKKSIRVDCVAIRKPSREQTRRFRHVEKRIQAGLLGGGAG